MEETVVVENGVPVELKSKFVAYLLWLFLGFTGWQNFYVGRKNLGYVELCLFICSFISLCIFADEPDPAEAVFFIIPAAILGILELYDLFTLASAVNKYNRYLLDRVNKKRILL